MKKTAYSILLVFAMLANASAFETDQYNLPPEPLVDIGEEVNGYVVDGLRKAIANLNGDIERSQTCLAGNGSKEFKCRPKGTELKKLEFARSEPGLAEAVYGQLGKGSLFITVTGKWFKTHKFAAEPSRYKTTFAESIFILMPIDYATISPTVKMYGVEFGTDKIEHFFQQGYKYYDIYNDSISEGRTADDAIKKAVRWGKRTERTYFGMLVSGVYSNADLVSNYVGMKFYQGLTRPVKIGDKTRPPIVRFSDGRWILNDETTLNRDLMRPFITDHFNEAFNPSGYSFILYPTVKRVVENKCPDWKKTYPQMTRNSVAKYLIDLETWYGEDYGFSTRGHNVSIAKCFDEVASLT